MEGTGKEQNSKRGIIIKKSLLAIGIVLVILAFFVYFQKAGWRLDWSVQKINYQKYSHIGPDFSFHYPDYYQFDGDTDKKFGDQYIAGFRLKTDQRTGCDLRYSSFGLNFQKSDMEIQNAIKADLSKSIKGFNLLSVKRIKFGAEDAFLAEFNFLDPTNNTMRLSQTLTSHAGADYIVVCGTGDYQYKYFQKDFKNFSDTFTWEK